MSSEVIILIIGAIALLIAVIDGVASIGLFKAKTRTPLGIIGLLLLIFGGYSFGAINLQGQIEQAAVGAKLEVNLPVERVQVISPIDGDSVKCRVLTMGVYPESHHKDIWVLLRPSDGRYYPQSDHTNTSYKRNGEWQVITRFGGSEGEIFELSVYETDDEASSFFTSIIQEWKDALSYPGLTDSEIPKGAKLVERIAVPLAGDCRGVF